MTLGSLGNCKNTSAIAQNSEPYLPISPRQITTPDSAPSFTKPAESEKRSSRQKSKTYSSGYCPRGSGPSRDQSSSRDSGSRIFIAFATYSLALDAPKTKTACSDASRLGRSSDTFPYTRATFFSSSISSMISTLTRYNPSDSY